MAHYLSILRVFEFLTCLHRSVIRKTPSSPSFSVLLSRNTNNIKLLQRRVRRTSGGRRGRVSLLLEGLVTRNRDGRQLPSGDSYTTHKDRCVETLLSSRR